MCTNILLKSESNKKIISARTMDFETELITTLYKVPRKHHYLVNNENLIEVGDISLSTKNKYGYLATEVRVKNSNIQIVVDGMNEVGLSVASLWLPCTKYPEHISKVNESSVNMFLPILLVAEHMLGRCKTIEEVKSIIDESKIIGYGLLEPLHLIFTDTLGKSLVLEFESHEVKTYKVDNGVLTNAPFYHQQLKNAKNYDYLKFNNKDHNDCGLKEEINGSGLIGLPGDSTPKSRFVKATEFSKIQFKPESQQDAITQLIQVIGSFYVPTGTILKEKADEIADYTQWSVIREHKGYDNEINYYFQTQKNSTLYKIELNKLNWVAEKKSQISFKQPNWVVDKTELL